MSGLVCGVGINDVNYVVTKSKTESYIDGKQKQVRLWTCPYYDKWVKMIERCYDKNFITKKPTYTECSVHNDWLHLSNFIRWVNEQPNNDWRNCHLDKDLLIEGNKHYSPSTCVFIDGEINKFILDGRSSRGDYLIGVSWHSIGNKFLARCKDPFKINNPYIGLFKTELEAHLAWQTRKHQYSCMLANLQIDSRVSEVLRTKYAPNKDWTKA
jgi:hypothetical protein